VIEFRNELMRRAAECLGKPCIRCDELAAGAVVGGRGMDLSTVEVFPACQSCLEDEDTPAFLEAERKKRHEQKK
jgi:hypothetical protein